MAILRTAVNNFVARPIHFIVFTIYNLCISLELDAAKMDLDLAAFRSTWKQLQDFSHAYHRSLDQIADDVKCAALWKKLAKRNRQRADDMYILERFSRLHHDGRRKNPWIYHPQEAVSLLAAQRRINNERISLKSILDSAVEEWENEKDECLKIFWAQMPGLREKLKVIGAEYEKTSALLA